MGISDYQKPVSELLQYGDPRSTDNNIGEWRDYIEELQLREEHIPELITMMMDDELYYAPTESIEVWSSLHAWRALAQLKAESAIIPLLNLSSKDEDNDWITEDFSQICLLIGVNIIPILADFLANSHNNYYARIDVGSALTKMGQQYPETRSQVVEIISQELEHFTCNDTEFNGLLIWYLMDLKAIESIAIIERAFQANWVNSRIVGTWEEVQIDMGLKSRDSRPSRHKNPFSIKSSSSKSVKGFGNQQSKSKSSSKKSNSKKKK